MASELFPLSFQYIYIFTFKKIVIQRPCLSYIFMLQPPFTTIKPALYSNVSWFSMNKTGSNQLTIPAPLGGPLPAASGLYFCVHWEHTGDLCELKQRPKRSVKSGVQKLHLCTVYMITGVYIYIFFCFFYNLHIHHIGTITISGEERPPNAGPCRHVTSISNL